jgi:hypothetical protein
MEAEAVTQAIESLITANRGTGEPLAVFQSVNNSAVKSGSEGQFPYLTISAPNQRLVLDAAKSKLHLVPVTMTVTANSRTSARTILGTLKNTVEPAFDNVAILSSLVESDFIQIYAAEEIDTVISRLADRVWSARWTIEFGTRTLKV